MMKEVGDGAPLSAQIGLALLLVFGATGIMLRGYYRIVDGPSYRRSGIAYFTGGLILLVAVALYWGFGIM